MKTFKELSIRVNAINIWNIIELKNAEMTIQEIYTSLSISFEEAMLAIGWLAKENNIFIDNKDGRLILSKCHSDFSFG